MTELIINLAIPIGLIILAMITGMIIESRHFQSIRQRESTFRGMPIINEKQFPTDQPIIDSRMVMGSVVVSNDYFKRFLAGLRNIVGGEVRSYVSLLDRGRREALLRMREQYPDADLIVNVRVETSAVSKGGKKEKIGSTEVLAYGTAIKFAGESAGRPSA